MALSTDVKYWIRSGSWKFAQARKPVASGDNPALEVLQWEGIPLCYRPGTSDVELIYRILLKPEKKREYVRPPIKDVKVIWDIGANIGVAAAWFAHQYPHARIECFEPVPSNVKVLEKNTAVLPGARANGFALGSRRGELEIFSSDNDQNEGGYSFHHAGINPSKKQKVAIRPVSEVHAELGSPQIDILKVDTEGSEYDILTAFPQEVLRNVRWILGELHGNKDFELLAYLSQWFDLQVKKDLRNRLMYFQAANKSQNLH